MYIRIHCSSSKILYLISTVCRAGGKSYAAHNHWTSPSVLGDHFYMGSLFHGITFAAIQGAPLTTSANTHPQNYYGKQ